MKDGSIVLTRPGWLIGHEGSAKRRMYRDDNEKMRLVIDCTTQNLSHHTGGPFCAALFGNRGNLLCVGTNMVPTSNVCILHAPVVAIIAYSSELGKHDLSDSSESPLTMVTIAEPCAMCAQAILISGVKRLVFGAPGQVKTKLGMEHGHDPLRRLEECGIELVRGVLAAEAKTVLEQTRNSGECGYNLKRD